VFIGFSLAPLLRHGAREFTALCRAYPKVSSVNQYRIHSRFTTCCFLIRFNRSAPLSMTPNEFRLL